MLCCQFDVEGLQPGCEGSSALFVSMWKQNWNLIAQYCLPSIFILLFIHLLLRFLESRYTSGHTARVLSVLASTLTVRQLDRSLRLSALLRAATQWTRDRLELASFTLIDLVFLTLCTMTLKGLICVEVDGAYRLYAEKSLLCWSHDHLPVAMFSVLVFPFLLLYPVFVYTYMQDRLEARKIMSMAVPKRRASARISARIRFARLRQRLWTRFSSMKGGRGASRSEGRSKARKSDEAVALKAGGLSGRSFKDKFKPIGMAYAPVFRLCLAVFVCAPLPSLQYRLILGILPLLFFGLIVGKHPFETLWMNACMILPALPPFKPPLLPMRRNVVHGFCRRL
jgi:hypothetical protein